MHCTTEEQANNWRQHAAKLLTACPASTCKSVLQKDTSPIPQHATPRRSYWHVTLHKEFCSTAFGDATASRSITHFHLSTTQCKGFTACTVWHTTHAKQHCYRRPHLLHLGCGHASRLCLLHHHQLECCHPCTRQVGSKNSQCRQQLHLRLCTHARQPRRCHGDEAIQERPVADNNVELGQ